MEVMQNAALAGGVMMGAACDIIVDPGYAMLAGCLAGIVSALGFLYFNPALSEKTSVQDTCGVLWLHGVPGILGSLTCAFAVAAFPVNFGDSVQATSLMRMYPVVRSAGD